MAAGRAQLLSLAWAARTTGDFLSSEDMELLESLAGYIGIAIQNAQLYRRLEQKITEFESLKEFHEKHRRVDQHRRLCCRSRRPDRELEYADGGGAVRQGAHRGSAPADLGRVLPPEFVARFNSVREETWHAHAFINSALLCRTAASELRISRSRRW
ncbi:MAG: GAF domain-containing protein [Edaphobacter sp.]